MINDPGETGAEQSSAHFDAAPDNENSDVGDEVQIARLATLSPTAHERQAVVAEQIGEPEVSGTQQHNSKERRAANQTDILIELAETADLFHSPDGAGYADLHVNGRRETWGIRSKGFQHWLSRAYYEHTLGAPNAEAMQSALSALEARARFGGPERVVHIRVGALGGKLYLS